MYKAHILINEGKNIKDEVLSNKNVEEFTSIYAFGDRDEITENFKVYNCKSEIKADLLKNIHKITIQKLNTEEKIELESPKIEFDGDNIVFVVKKYKKHNRENAL